jgi:two-component system, cell cycle sensor histidine kinase and response regulator CckA
MNDAALTLCECTRSVAGNPKGDGSIYRERMELPIKTILIVEDEIITGMDIHRTLKKHGYNVAPVISEGEGVPDAVAEHHPDLILMDIHLRGRLDGIAAASAIHESSQVPVVFLTANADDATYERATVAAPYGFLIKPFNDRELFSAVENALQRSRLEHQLRESEQQLAGYRLLFEESKDAVFILARNGRFIDINSAGVAMLGYKRKSEIAAITTITDIFTDARVLLTILNAILLDDFIQDYELILKKKDGKPVITLVTASIVRDESGAISGFRGFVRDITAQRQIEIQLMHAQKMESIGTLAGGIAHDFNNVLSMVLSAAELTKKNSEDPAKVSRYSDMITEATRRGTSIAKQLLLFARSEQMDLNVLSISHIIDEIVLLMEHTLPKTISIHTRYLVTNGLIQGDSSYLHQALLNLAINAKDAMPAGGTISFSVSNIEGSVLRQKHATATDAQYIALSVHDNGMGMDEQTRSRIFEPFFSTKVRGKGTGLGLAIVHGIVKSHNGHIDVTSRQGKGTTFILYFPTVQSREPVRSLVPERTGPDGDETILIVDDEQFIRDTISDILRDHGYSVIEAPNGVEALQLYAAKKDHIALVITDLGMPGISGEELFVKLQEINPQVKAIVSTGYLEHLTKSDMLAMGVLEVIQKPFNITQILGVVRAALDEAPTVVKV